MYEATQMQRRLERAIRRMKNHILVDETTGDKEKLLTDQVKLRRLNEEYRRFSKTADLPTQWERAQKVGFEGERTTEANAAAGRYYQKWSRGIGIHESIETLAKYYDIKYTDSPRHKLLQGYVKAVEKADISPLVGFEEYENINNELLNRIVGVTAQNGVTIESFATHFIDRIIGQTSTPHSGMRRGVLIDDAIDALKNPLKVNPVRILADGDVRQTLVGLRADITISIRDKRLIQTNPNKEAVPC